VTHGCRTKLSAKAGSTLVEAHVRAAERADVARGGPGVTRGPRLFGTHPYDGSREAARGLCDSLVDLRQFGDVADVDERARAAATAKDCTKSGKVRSPGLTTIQGSIGVILHPIWRILRPAPTVSDHVLPPAHRRRLELYNEQAEVLLGSRFAAVMFGQMTGMTLSWEEGGPLQATVKGPDDEAVRAFALTFRMFFRDGDGISFREMAEIYTRRRFRPPYARTIAGRGRRSTSSSTARPCSRSTKSASPAGGSLRYSSTGASGT
jgi:hypothetical protein